MVLVEKCAPILLKAAECPVEAVTVFTENAEVTRLVHVQLLEGTQDIVIKGCSEHIDPNSLRVSAGKVKLSILEVAYTTIHDPVTSEMVLALEEKQNHLKELEVLESKLKSRNSEIEESKRIIESYADRLTELSGDPPADVSELLTEPSIKGIHEFMKIYKEKLAAFDFDQEELAKGLRDLTKRRATMHEDIRELTKAMTEITHQVTIAIYAPEPVSLILRLMYLVSNCRWSPCYDIRALTQDTHKIGITSFGVIQQASGEDWDKAKIILSTSKPSISGTPPSLIPQTVQLRANSPLRPPAPRKRTPSEPKAKRKNVMGGEYEMGFNSLEDVDIASHNSHLPASSFPSFPPLPQEKHNQMLSVVFAVPRVTTIKCDNKPHKVTIVVAEVGAKFTHTAVPRKEQRAYLTAVITNSTDYPFLAGPSSIFLDNEFVSTSPIPDISPQEQFEAHLGVDPTVKIEYKPIQKRKELAGSSSGKTQSQSFTHHTIIKNTKPAEIDITVIDQYPRPTDERIRVRLIEPPQEEGTYHAVNDAHNIEWRFIVPPEEITDIKYSYAVDWPVDREIDLSAVG